MDRTLYLPKCWTDDDERLAGARVPDDVIFATKSALAQTMITRAVDSGIRASWAAGDEVYGADSKLRKHLRCPRNTIDWAPSA